MRILFVRFVAALLLSLLGVAALSDWPGRAASVQNASGQSKPEQEASLPGFDVASLDRSVGACEDFNQFANGGWMAKNPVPAAYSRWGRFEQLNAQNLEVLHSVLEELIKKKNLVRGSNEQKIADFYASCMDETTIEREGLSPLAPELKRIEQLSSLADLETETARLHRYSIPVIFGFGAAQDFKNSRQVIAMAVQGGLGLPDRDYYTKEDENSKRTRDEYLKHVARMFELAGDAPEQAQAEAATVMSIETRLAQKSMTRVERRDPAAIYHKMTVAELKTLTPHFNWTRYMKEVGLGQIEAINVAMPDFFKAADELLSTVPVSDWKTYLRWHLLNAAAETLSSKFVEEDFKFNKAFLTGAKENLPRWRRCVTSTDNSLGEALGQLYVEKTFTPQAKARAQEMVRNLIAALRADLSTLSWMSDETRKRAIAKLDAFVRKIGFPDTWRSYEALQINNGPYYNNAVAANAFEFSRDLRKIGRPLDRTEWGMTPPTVNAYYNPSMNEIVFPAGILQPPFYDPQADDAFNYGGIGAVIGHEMTHGFDDKGAQFDAEGNLLNWWTPEDLKKFNERTGCVVAQFDAYEVEPGLRQNGKLVVGESVADLGGLTVAYAAYQKSLEGKPRPPTINGFTPEQRFFLGWAQVWAQNIRPEAARLRVATDPHPLGRFRVNGPLSNMPAFAGAFGCKAGDPMVRPPEKRCQIW
ncbi:MAG TPA: M13 family metallopeptidase [Pyrinomonadaceae bacterium]|jgi:putative endopeptidase|nr:M13 family metallopeptidase [Pyrinomonadaceae bacterium]